MYSVRLVCHLLNNINNSEILLTRCYLMNNSMREMQQSIDINTETLVVCDDGENSSKYFSFEWHGLSYPNCHQVKLV